MNSPFTFNPVRQQYRLKSGQAGAGQFVKKEAVRKVIDEDRDFQKERMATIDARLKLMAQRHQDGTLTDAELKGEVALWNKRRKQVIAAANLNYAAAGRGGIEQMDAAAYGRAGARIKYHYKASDGFAADILENPKLALEKVAGRVDFQTRSDMAIDTALFAFNAEQALSHKENGWPYYENEPHSQESCQNSHALPGCDEITMAGIQEVGDLPEHGKRACGPKCECGWKFYKGPFEGIEKYEFAPREAKFYDHATGIGAR